MFSTFIYKDKNNLFRIEGHFVISEQNFDITNCENINELRNEVAPDLMELLAELKEARNANS